MRKQARARSGPVVSSSTFRSMPTSSAPKLRGWRLWLLRGLLAALAPVVLLVFVEGILRLFGYGYPVSFLLKADSGDQYFTNQKYVWQFQSHSTALKPFPARLPVQKSPGTIRICVLGESAAMGTPDPAFGLSRILESQLRAQYPDRRFEVLNAAIRGINSHVIRHLAQECAEHQFDVFVVYMGNNEVIGLHGPEPGTPGWIQSRGLIRTSHWLRTTKLGQFFHVNLGRMKAEAPKHDMAYFRAHSLRPDDWRREQNRENFRANLQDILNSATRSGAHVLLATVASNLKDFPPLQSLHRANLSPADKARWDTAYQQGCDSATRHEWRPAIKSFFEAEAIDDHFAELHFRLADALLAAGDAARAKTYFALARDWDALQVRVDAKANQVIRELGSRYAGRGVTLVDVETAFASSPLSNQGIPGEKLFCDHVHPAFTGNYLLARTLLDHLASQLSPVLGKPATAQPLTVSECAQALAYTPYDDLNVAGGMIRMTAGPPFLDQLNHLSRQSAAESANRQAFAAFSAADAEACLNTYREALQRHPDDWPIHYNLGFFLVELHRFPEAAEHLAVAVREFPQVGRFHLSLAGAFLGEGQTNRALPELRQAARLEPENKEAQALLLKSQAHQL